MDQVESDLLGRMCMRVIGFLDLPEIWSSQKLFGVDRPVGPILLLSRLDALCNSVLGGSISFLVDPHGRADI